MTEVNLPSPMLLGLLLKQATAAVLAADVDGLRVSRLRLLAELPAEGLRITELAERTGITKQACGQLVTDLTASGHVVTGAAADDRRVRLVRLTPKGRKAVAAFHRVLQGVDAGWAQRVGQERFAAFRAVLAQLTEGEQAL